MNSGFYAAFTGYEARINALDVLANNLANANTSGFKAQSTFYRTFADWMDPYYESPINLAANQYGVLGGTRLDMTQGALTLTGNDMDVALQGPGFIAVLTAAGIRYTRDGNFALDKDRKLVTQRGEAVLSEQPAGRPPQPIVLPPGKMTISPDGTVSVDGALVAKLRIESFPAETAMTQEGGSNLVAPAGVAGEPATGVTVLQGSVENSNADSVRTTVAIMDLERTAQAMEKALSIFHNEFNKTAAQDIGRI
ncbi:MAG: flagellar hook basal-body protein [Candidatus Acidiferrum sp.]|jgi:flagellar basal-body rod protein FlgF/flagellar basal-body rod protein FlgG